MHTFEIELRYKILDGSQLPAFLKPLHKISQKNDLDIYLDSPDVRLYQQGIFVRVRNNKKIEFKFNRDCINNPHLGLQDYCEEHSFALPLAPIDFDTFNTVATYLGFLPCTYNFESWKQENNLAVHYSVDKVRTSYQHKLFTLSIDEVKNLGTFLEIELMATTVENVAPIKQEMQEFLSPLSLEPLKTGYGTLMVRQNNFEQYLLGRFILPEDKHHQRSSWLSKQ